MQNGLELLHKRRSIRKYTSEPVSKADIEAMLKAAMAAPSASNKQPWNFVLVQERSMLDQLAEVHNYAKMLKEASACIVVCGDTSNKYWEQDCSAATQNILLAATALGLGSVWLGIHPNAEPVQKVSEWLKIGSTYVPLCLIAIGHPAEEKGPSDRYDESKVHYEQW